MNESVANTVEEFKKWRLNETLGDLTDGEIAFGQKVWDYQAGHYEEMLETYRELVALYADAIADKTAEIESLNASFSAIGEAFAFLRS